MTPSESAAALVQQGKLDEALIAVRALVRSSPQDIAHRLFLLQLQLVMGDWEKASLQVGFFAEQEGEEKYLAPVLGSALQSEVFRAEVFAGKRTPLVFGEPEPWVSLLVQALQTLAAGDHATAESLRAKAFEDAPALSGSVNGQPFAWIADADPRLGPLLEAIIHGKYYWLPFARVRRIEIKPPADLRDVVWTPAKFTWVNGGEAMGFIPARYSGTEKSSDPSLRLARRTEWIPLGSGDLHAGLGQRILATDAADFSLLDIRTLEMDTPAP